MRAYSSQFIKAKRYLDAIKSKAANPTLTIRKNIIKFKDTLSIKGKQRFCNVKIDTMKKTIFARCADILYIASL
jgi:hypothetical protein